MRDVWLGRFKAARHVLLAAIVVYLAYRLTQIGWGSIAGALPINPLFYLLSAAIFLVLPVSEIVNYRLLTGQYIPDGLRIFGRKRVYNDALISYSGEAYLYSRLSDAPGLDQKAAFVAIKDNTLVSAIVSNSWTILLVGAVLIAGRGDVLDQIWNQAPILVGGFAVICLIVYAAVIFFFGRVSALSKAKIGQLVMVHGAKVSLVAALQVVQWATAIPDAAASTLLIFLTVQTLLKRIPGLPNGDLLFLTLGISLAGFLPGSTAAITAMLVAATATTQLIQLAVFIGTSGLKQCAE